MTRSELQDLIETLQSGIPNPALTVRNIMGGLADGVAKSYQVIELDVPTAFIASNFDPTGLGTGDWLGWAICNGNNGTRDRSGRVGMQYSSTYPTLGATGGASAHTLTVNEIPAHNHTVAYNSNDAGGGGSQRTLDNSGISTVYNQTGYTGGGASHNNMQPYLVSLFVMKLPE